MCRNKHTQGPAGQQSNINSSAPLGGQRIDWTSVWFVTGDHGDWDTAQACYPALSWRRALKQRKLTGTNGEHHSYYMTHLCALSSRVRK